MIGKPLVSSLSFGHSSTFNTEFNHPSFFFTQGGLLAWIGLLPIGLPATDTPSTPLSKFLVHALTPLLNHVDAHLKNTEDFIKFS